MVYLFGAGQAQDVSIRGKKWLKEAFYGVSNNWSMHAIILDPGQHVPLLQATYKVERASGQGGGVLERGVGIDLVRVDSLPDGWKACFTDEVFPIPLLDSRMFNHGDEARRGSNRLDKRSLTLFEPKDGDRLKAADLRISLDEYLSDGTTKKISRWVTVSKDSVFELRNDKELKVWLKVVDFVPRDDELGITGWIRAMRVEEPVTVTKPNPAKPGPSRPAPVESSQPPTPKAMMP
jgi:hypothetical protein